MAKALHTHRGTCQACGAKQAVSNGSMLVAKHGYRVAGFGFFNGTCAGSDHRPAEHDVTLTYSIIADLQAWALNADRLAALYRSRDLIVYTHERHRYDSASGRTRYFQVDMFGCDDYTIKCAYDWNTYGQERQARQARDHIEMLTVHVLPRLCKALYPVERKAPPRQFTVGEVVRLVSNGISIQLTGSRHGGFRNRPGAITGWTYVRIDDKSPGYISMRALRAEAI